MADIARSTLPKCRQARSSAYESVDSVGWQWHHLSFEIRHISNGRLHQPNRGETMALVGVGFDIQ